MHQLGGGKDDAVAAAPRDVNLGRVAGLCAGTP
jgi:hypothetical protein